MPTATATTRVRRTPATAMEATGRRRVEPAALAVAAAMESFRRRCGVRSEAALASRRLRTEAGRRRLTLTVALGRTREASLVRGLRGRAEPRRRLSLVA